MYIIFRKHLILICVFNFNCIINLTLEIDSKLKVIDGYPSIEMITNLGQTELLACSIEYPITELYDNGEDGSGWIEHMIKWQRKSIEVNTLFNYVFDRYVYISYLSPTII